MRRFIVAAEKVHAGMDPTKLITIHPNFRTIVLANRPGPMAIASPVSQRGQLVAHGLADAAAAAAAAEVAGAHLPPVLCDALWRS
jgi:hypothetical protein